ncbi:MAG: DUF2997 domain-containing protein [Candidatus Aminicenantes bacterium]|nr:DUF2997 domain-containing protein [Candidatus Aminicenantes bacterium]NIM84243.1 DUF2997 domain-containing protein [Candidatus Aminicenantes bacterium]NIN23692.1 DUF2997 domain-containing protein [Candidatus Aminicenantes bacterium]NIN47399.1 DUF2997 domain-containing protein [Candidatus Aminicenantes bacterium]NIN90327.1 DUF2997 domain-containing protein [Candidatus Aminicenantes bacterium]
MSELQEVEVVISPGGKVQVRVTGVKGTRCLDITDNMIQLLGERVEQQELTDEYYQQTETREEWQVQKVK